MAFSRPLPPIIGEAPAFLAMLEHVSGAARVSKPILVVGERGTGKELIASRLHYLSPRWEQPLVKVNCAALTESILESELFGHEAGAFTGASSRHIGHFERADGGTLILDELGTISLRMQEKILRIIEYGEFSRVGGTDTLTVDVRIVGATNADLRALTSKGEFRADLLDRLAFDVVTIPPLRERLDDILPLAQSFAVTMAAELRQPYFPGFSSRAASALLRYQWPGNVRELKNTIERSVYRHADADRKLAKIVFDPFASAFELQTESVGLADPAEPTVDSAKDKPRPQFPVELKTLLADREADWVQRALRRANYRQQVAAQLLGLTYHQLRGAMRKHGISAKPDADQDSASVR